MEALSGEQPNSYDDQNDHSYLYQVVYSNTHNNLMTITKSVACTITKPIPVTLLRFPA